MGFKPPHPLLRIIANTISRKFYSPKENSSQGECPSVRKQQVQKDSGKGERKETGGEWMWMDCSFLSRLSVLLCWILLSPISLIHRRGRTSQFCVWLALMGSMGRCAFITYKSPVSFVLSSQHWAACFLHSISTGLCLFLPWTSSTKKWSGL